MHSTMTDQSLPGGGLHFQHFTQISMSISAYKFVSVTSDMNSIKKKRKKQSGPSVQQIHMQRCAHEIAEPYEEDHTYIYELYTRYSLDYSSAFRCGTTLSIYLASLICK